MWSEHIIRSALPGKPNLRSKLCQVRRSIMMTTIAMMMVMILFLMMTTTATRCTLRPNPGGVAGWLHGPLSMIQNLDRKWKKIFGAKPLCTFFAGANIHILWCRIEEWKEYEAEVKDLVGSSFYFCFKCWSCIFMFSIWALRPLIAFGPMALDLLFLLPDGTHFKRQLFKKPRIP